MAGENDMISALRLVWPVNARNARVSMVPSSLRFLSGNAPVEEHVLPHGAASYPVDAVAGCM